MYTIADTAQQPTAPTVQCKAWEKLFKGRCICKMANECRYIFSDNQQFGHNSLCKLADLIDYLILLIVVYAYSCPFFLFSSSSLELCVTSSASSTFYPISVCKMHALQCAGKNVEITEHSSCNWPQRKTEGCTDCHMWEKCDGRNIQGHNQFITMDSSCMFFTVHPICSHLILLDQTNTCRCKNPEDCSNPGLSVCVRVGENAAVATQTMSECEAGLRQCKGERVSIVSILPCAS